jgi:DNA-binding LacI/PurR family transcriptional regulator
MQVLRERDRSVPGDVAVVGFDNIAIGRYITPALTTVSPNLTDGVPVLVEKLLRLINGETEDPVTIPGRLVVRQSCGAAAGNGAS